MLHRTFVRATGRQILAPVVVGLLVATGGIPAAGWPGEPGLEALEEQAFKQAAALAAPSIVRIQTVGGRDRIGQLLAGTAATTGVIVTPDGFILSSAFNFAAEPSSILVELPDGRRLPARLIATDHARMLTLLAVEATDLTPIQTATADDIRVGQWAIALGRTYDSPIPSISVGIISAVNRIWGRALQTDAKVSPVNYGGPLLDVSGKALGILVPLSPSGTDEVAGVEWYDSGIGFAVPMDDALSSAKRLMDGKDLRPGLMGITFARGPFGGKPVIDRVRVNSPAAEAGLKTGDMIVEADGTPVRRDADVRTALGRKYAGDAVTLAVERDGKKISAELKLVAELVPYEIGFLGILPERRSANDPRNEGVGVRYVFAESPAAKVGVQPGDVIVKFAGKPVKTAAELEDFVGCNLPGQKAALVYRRGSNVHEASVELATIPANIPAELPSAPIPSAPAAAPGHTPEKTGRLTVELPEYRQSYTAYVPDDYNPNFAYTLLVWLHPDGDPMDVEILRHWKAICDQRGIMLLAPKAAQIQGWQLNEADFVKAAVEHFQNTYRVDPDRVFLHAYSTGGGFAAYLAFTQRKLFRGLAIAGAPLQMAPPENDPDERLSFLFICGRNDDLFTRVEKSVELLRQIKYPVNFTPVDELDHRYPPPQQVEEMGRWADSLDRI